MPSTANSADAAAIEAAYTAQVEALYKQLATGLIDGGGTPGAEQQSVDRFATGLKFARGATELALKVIGPVAAPAAVDMARSKKARK